MKDSVPEILDTGDLNKLVEEGKALFFNYVGPLPDISKEQLFTLIKGKGNALIYPDLYTKHGNFDYCLGIKDWIKKEEAKKYTSLFLKILHSERREHLLKYISKRLN